ncbi:MAG: hypothetical protein K6L73_07020 [Cellvibrionaceae bacterium]
MSETSHFLILIAVMLLVGLAAGWLNHKVWHGRGGRNSPLRINLLIACGGAFLIPLALVLFSSDLIETSKELGLPLVRYGMMAFGMALLSVTTVLTLPQLTQGNRTQASHMEPPVKVSMADTQTHAALSQGQVPTEPKTPEEVTSDVEPPTLGDNERCLLLALGGGEYPYRAVNGLCKETGLDNFDVLSSLESLEEKGLVGSVNTKKGIRWHLSKKGKGVVAGQGSFNF